MVIVRAADLSEQNCIVSEQPVGRSFICKRNRTGPRTVPCGTPDDTFDHSDTKFPVFYASDGFPSKHKFKNILMIILLISIHGLLSALHAERTMRFKVVYFTRQRFACTIIDAETLTLVPTSDVSGIGRTLRSSVNQNDVSGK